MLTDQFISLKEFCQYHKVEYTFVQALCESDLFEVTTLSEEIYIRAEHIGKLEKMVRLHIDLGINSEGIETIFHLLNKIDELQTENIMLQNKLSFYENE